MTEKSIDDQIKDAEAQYHGLHSQYPPDLEGEIAREMAMEDEERRRGLPEGALAAQRKIQELRRIKEAQESEARAKEAEETAAEIQKAIKTELKAPARSIRRMSFWASAGILTGLFSLILANRIPPSLAVSTSWAFVLTATGILLSIMFEASNAIRYDLIWTNTNKSIDEGHPLTPKEQRAIAHNVIWSRWDLGIAIVQVALTIGAGVLMRHILVEVVMIQTGGS